MKKAKSFLSSIDLFPTEIGFCYFGRKRISSWPSILFTLVIITLSLLALIEFSKGFVGAENPIVSKSERNYFSNSVFLENENENTILGVNLVFDNGTFLENSSNIKFYLIYASSNYSDYNDRKVNKTVYQFTSCEDYFDDFQFLGGFSINQVEQLRFFSCFDFKRAEHLSGPPINKLELMGDFLKPINKEANIVASICPWNKKVSDFLCDGNEYGKVSDDDLNKLSLIMFFPNFEMHFENYEIPIKKFMEIKNLPLQYNCTKSVEIRFTRAILTTDNGWIMENHGTKEFFLLEEFSQMDAKKQGSLIASIRLFSSMKENLFKRKYDKLQDVLAKVGGVMKVLIFLTTNILSPFNKLQSFFFLLKNIGKEISENPNSKKSKPKMVIYNNPIQNQRNNFKSPNLLQIMMLSYIPIRLHKYFESIKWLKVRMKKGAKIVDFQFILKKIKDINSENLISLEMSKTLPPKPGPSIEIQNLKKQDLFRTLPSIELEPTIKKSHLQSPANNII